MSDVSKSIRSLIKNEQCEWIAQVALQKWATMSNLLRSLIFYERVAQKTDEQIPNPAEKAWNSKKGMKL